LWEEALDRCHQPLTIDRQFLAIAPGRRIDHARQISRSQFVNGCFRDVARQLEHTGIPWRAAVIKQDENDALRAEMVGDNVRRDVASPRRTGSQPIGQVDCRESHHGLLDSAIDNGEVSRGQPTNRLPIPIEYRDVDLDDVRSGPEHRRLLRARGRDGARCHDADEQNCGRSSQRISRDRVILL